MRRISPTLACSSLVLLSNCVLLWHISIAHACGVSQPGSRASGCTAFFRCCTAGLPQHTVLASRSSHACCWRLSCTVAGNYSLGLGVSRTYLYTYTYGRLLKVVPCSSAAAVKPRPELVVLQSLQLLSLDEGGVTQAKHCILDVSNKTTANQSHQKTVVVTRLTSTVQRPASSHTQHDDVKHQACTTQLLHQMLQSLSSLAMQMTLQL